MFLSLHLPLLPLSSTQQAPATAISLSPKNSYRGNPPMSTPSSTTSRGSLLKHTRLFHALDKSLRKDISQHFERLPFPAAAQVFEQGQPADTLLFLVEGEVTTTLREQEYGLDYYGPEIAIGDDIDLESALLNEPHLFTLRTKTPSLFLAIPIHTLKQLALQHPSLQQAISHTLSLQLFRERALKQTPFVDLARIVLDPTLLSIIPRHLINKHKLLPLSEHGGILAVGLVDLQNLHAIDDIRRFVKGKHIHPLPIDNYSFERFLRNFVNPILDRREKKLADEDDRWFNVLKSKEYNALEINEGKDASTDKRNQQIPGEQIVQLMNRLIGEAIDLMASDIHIEPGTSELVVRYRVDGRLKKRPETLEMRYHSALVSRLKILSGMDIAERRQAQDGRLRLGYEGKPIDFRLSTIPSHFGEKLVLRLLDPNNILIELERLIPHLPTLQAVQWMLQQPQGMVLMAGPTGSGKTTTIYSALLHRREDEVNIVTVEDPIEYTVEGIAQVQVNEAAGMGFANSIRHFLRQDPDIIVVGETRDPITASTALKAALTGHLVITSIHANSALGTLVRLRDMGIEPFLIANTVTGVVSQRLVRRICPHCREVVKYHRNLILPLGIFEQPDPPEYFEFYRGKGCVHCNFLGYRGRVGVFEVLRIDETLRPMLAIDEQSVHLRRLAIERGLLLPMQQYSRYLLTQGMTTPEEITRVLFIENIHSSPSSPHPKTLSTPNTTPSLPSTQPTTPLAPVSNLLTPPPPSNPAVSAQTIPNPAVSANLLPPSSQTFSPTPLQTSSSSQPLPNPSNIAAFHRSASLPLSVSPDFPKPSSSSPSHTLSAVPPAEISAQPPSKHDPSETIQVTSLKGFELDDDDENPHKIP
ncbi:Flp pilus assembly complex ATPase component TadA [Myxococcota bacterium]|nr:Flp pilus assembly complex ATPase component TadA [Myxococcota bacterium]